MITFETKSGSTYEVDSDGRRIRRVSGRTPPHRSVSPNWRSFEALSSIEPGDCVRIAWLNGSATITSPVVRVEKTS